MRSIRGISHLRWTERDRRSIRRSQAWPGVPHVSPFLRDVGVSAGFILRWTAAVRVVALILFSAFLLSGASPEKHLSVYSIAANYSLPVVQRESRDYVGLLELLEPLGKVTAKVDGSRWRLH